MRIASSPNERVLSTFCSSEIDDHAKKEGASSFMGVSSLPILARFGLGIVSLRPALGVCCVGISPDRPQLPRLQLKS